MKTIGLNDGSHILRKRLWPMPESQLFGGAMRGRTATLASVCDVVMLAGTITQCQAQNAVAIKPPTVCTVDPQLPAFDVAAITPVAEKDRGLTSIGQYGLPHFALRSVSLSLLLSLSFDVQPENFIDAPRGLENAVFDVQVGSEDGIPLTYEALKPRMQQLLEQRFCLQSYTGTKQVSGYALMSAKGGAKLTPASTPNVRGAAYITQHEVSGMNIDMNTLASMLASPAGRPVQNKTGLQGKYTVKVQFASATDTESTLPSVFTAVKEQLGLELRPAQVPVQTLTIEHLNLKPTEN